MSVSHFDMSDDFFFSCLIPYWVEILSLRCYYGKKLKGKKISRPPTKKHGTEKIIQETKGLQVCIYIHFLIDIEC